MFNFFHNLSIGIVSAFIAFTGAFHSQPTSTIQVPVVQVASTPTREISATSSKTVEVKSTIPSSQPDFSTLKPYVPPATDNAALIQAEVQKQVQASIQAKAAQDALVVKQKADAQAQIDAQNAASVTAQEAAQAAATQKAQNDAAYAILHQNDAAINAQNAKENSSACITAKNTYNNLNQQYQAIMNQANSYNSVLTNPSLTSSDMSAIINKQTAIETSPQATTLLIQSQTAFNAMNEACQTWLPAPTPIYQTNCYGSGASYNCFTQ